MGPVVGFDPIALLRSVAGYLAGFSTQGVGDGGVLPVRRSFKDACKADAGSNGDVVHFVVLLPGGLIRVGDEFKFPVSEVLETTPEGPVTQRPDFPLGCPWRADAFANLAGVCVMLDSIVDLRRIKRAIVSSDQGIVKFILPNRDWVRESRFLRFLPSAFRAEVPWCRAGDAWRMDVTGAVFDRATLDGPATSEAVASLAFAKAERGCSFGAHFIFVLKAGAPGVR